MAMRAIGKSIQVLVYWKLTISATDDTAGLLPPLRVLSDIV